MFKHQSLQKACRLLNFSYRPSAIYKYFEQVKLKVPPWLTPKLIWKNKVCYSVLYSNTKIGFTMFILIS